MAAGGDNIAAIDTEPVESAHTLYGAIVGGRECRACGPTCVLSSERVLTLRSPSFLELADKSDRFFDKRSDYIETEVSDQNRTMS